MIKLRGVSKYYSSNGIVSTGFSRIDLDLEMGEFVAITGESGSGKSTLLNVISGLDTYEEGEMTVMGQETSGFSKQELEEYRKKYIGNIFQTFNLIGSYTVYQNVELILLLNGKKPSEVREEVLSIIKKVGLEGYEKQKASKLSGGQKQRVSIARALAKETPIIVADEPTGNLDTKSAAGIVELLHEISKDKLVILVTHNYEQVEPFVTRKITMYDGSIAEDKKFASRVEKERDSQGESKSRGNICNSQEEVATPHGKDDAFNEIANGNPDEKEQAQGLEIGGLGALNSIRLGVRNAFNLPAKFILLFMVLTFLSVGVTILYSSNNQLDKEMSNFGYNVYFTDTSPKRVVIAKADKGVMTEDDISSIEEMDEVDYIVKNDYIGDGMFYIGAQGFGGNGIFSNKVASEFKGLKIEGRLPENYGEFLLLLVGDDQSGMKTKDYVGKSPNIGGENWDMKLGKIDITGVAKLDENMKKSFFSSEFLRPEYILVPGTKSLDEILAIKSDIINFKGTSIKTGSIEVNSPLVVQNQSIPKGEAYISAILDGSMGLGKEKKLKVSTEIGSEARTIELKAGKVFSDKDTLNLFSKDAYESYTSAIFINTEDYISLFKDSHRQISAYTKTDEMAPMLKQKLEEKGYKAFRVSDGTSNSFGIMNSVLDIFRGMFNLILYIGIFYICYFIISLIMKSRNVYYSTIRMIGATKNNCSWLIRIELFVILNIAFASTITAAYLAMKGYLKISFLENALRLMGGFDYVILYGIILIMTLLIAKRYAKRMFKKSAMAAHREEV